METMPTPLDQLVDGSDQFRISEPHEVAGMLRQLSLGNVALQLYGTGEQAAAATLWSADVERGTVSFAVDFDDPGLPSVLESDAVVAVGYLDNVKVQFDADRLVLVHGPRSCVATCAHPDELYRFQRRHAYRVRPPSRLSPTAYLRHTDIAEMQLALRLLDVSIGGCALLLPADVPALQIGGVLSQVRIDLDEQTRLTVDLRLQHATSLSGDGHGMRLGCAFVRPDATTQRTLQRFIDQAQKRSRAITLE